jgi:molybdenum cofactor cytidylyltransferase
MSAAEVYRIGVLLAAGRGRRMGRTKQLVPWPSDAGEKPLVAAAFDAIQSICDEVVIVLGHEAGLVAAALGNRNFHRAFSDPDAPMFASIRAGLCAAQIINSQASIVLHPADHPEVAPATLATLTEWSHQRPAHAIIPQYHGRGGHPALLPPNIVLQLLDVDGTRGLRQVWIDHPELCHWVAVEDASVLRNIDTMADLAP